jgi:hypothetical protein
MIYGRWTGDDGTVARLAAVAPRDAPKGYAGTLAALFTENPRRGLLGNPEGMKKGPGWRYHRVEIPVP